MQSTATEDRAHASRIAPYRVTDSGRDERDVLREVNLVCYNGYGPDWRERGGAVGTLADSFAQYERLLDDLVAAPQVDVVPFRRLLDEAPGPGRVRCAIRHDVDIDVRAALMCAQAETARDLESTYFILHTAPYYGTFDGDSFRRHGAMAATYRSLQHLGHEIALHTDPLLVYQTHGMDGAEALRVEIEWLRAQGLVVEGTTAHNSVSVYGAANFAIFKGRPQSFLADPADCPAEIVHNGRWAPLGVLDERELGLKYEANDVFWQPRIPVRYGVTWGVNRWWWEDEKCVPRLRDPVAGASRFAGYLDYEEVKHRIDRLQGGEYLVLVVHPLYYGLRASQLEAPAHGCERRPTTLNVDLGWETYAPLRVVCRTGRRADGTIEFQSANFANSHGQLDLPKPDSEESGRRVLLLGGTNVAGETVGTGASMSALLQEALGDAGCAGARVWKYAFPAMSFTRLFGWYARVASTLAPHAVVIGVGADDPVLGLPEGWRAVTGYHPSAAPGEYLDFDGDVLVRDAAPAGALVNRAAPGITANAWLDAADDTPVPAWLQATLAWFVGRVRSDGAEPVLLLQECGERAGHWHIDRPLAERAAVHARVAGRFASLAAELGVGFADPYALMLEDDSPGHWQTDCEWNFRGHRLAALALAQLLAEHLRPMPGGDEGSRA